MKKYLIVIGITLVFLIVGLSGCMGNKSTDSLDSNNQYKGDIFIDLYIECSDIIKNKPFSELVTVSGNYDSDYYEIIIRDFNDFMVEVELSDNGEFYVITIPYDVEFIKDSTFEYFWGKAKLENGAWIIRDSDDYVCSLSIFEKYWDTDIIYDTLLDLPVTFTGCGSEVTSVFVLEADKTVEFDITLSCTDFPNSISLYSEKGIAEFILDIYDYDYKIKKSYDVEYHHVHGDILKAGKHYLDMHISCEDNLPGANYCWIAKVYYV